MRFSSKIAVALALLWAPLLSRGEDHSPVEWHTPPGAASASAHGVTFYYDQKLHLKQEKNEAGTELSVRAESDLPWIRVQVYDVPVTMPMAMKSAVGEHTKMCDQKGWPHREAPSTQLIAGERVVGQECLYSLGDLEFRQRFFVFRLQQRIVLLVTMSKVADDALTRKYLALVTTSLH